MKPILSIKDLTVSFPKLFNTITAVRGLDLDLYAGQITGLVGESGSGKSMTAAAAMGLITNQAEVTGNIHWQDKTWAAADMAKAGRQIRGAGCAMIFQNPLTALNPFFSVGQQIFDVARQHRSMTTIEIEKEVKQCLAQVHLPQPEKLYTKYPHELSGGQIQRVVIAMALICQPRVLIADEPTTALDVTVQSQILALVRELTDEKQLSVLLITHDLSVVATVCDQVSVMYAGQIVEQGDVRQVIKFPVHPYTQKLLATVPEIGNSTILEHIPGQVPDLGKPVVGCAFKDRCEKRTERCLQTPTLVEAEMGHQYRCFHPELDNLNHNVREETMV